MAINMRRLELENKQLADLVRLVFSEAEIEALVAARDEADRFVGVGFMSDQDQFTRHADPVKATVIEELEGYMARRSGQ